MKITIVITFFLGLLTLFTVCAEPEGQPKRPAKQLNITWAFSPNPTEFAEYWLSSIQRLYEAIPSLSPREEQWLMEMGAIPDLKSKDDPYWRAKGGVTFEKQNRAQGSLEYSIWDAKRDAGILRMHLQVLLKIINPSPPRHPAVDWGHLAHSLLDRDAALQLARLEAKGVIPREVIPVPWSILANADYPLQNAIRDQRLTLARHILFLLIPKTFE